MSKERYQITFLGLLSLGHRDMEELQDQIELYLRRNDWNSIILTGPRKFEFHKVEFIPDGAKKEAKPSNSVGLERKKRRSVRNIKAGSRKRKSKIQLKVCKRRKN